MEFEVDKVYKFRNPGTTKTTDRTISRIEDGMIYWRVPQSKAEFAADVGFFESQWEESGVKED